MTPAELARRYPLLYHMAELGSWPNIQKYGLLSTSALLDLYGFTGQDREAIESNWRPRSFEVPHQTYGTAIVRDQSPMQEDKLHGCLADMTTREWYELINGKTFFWLDQTRLIWMLKTPPYRDREHCVIVVPTLTLLDHHADKVTLSAINSGSVNPSRATGLPRSRGRDTFKPIDDFNARWVAELTVEYSVPNIADLAVRAEAWRSERRLRLIWNRNSHA